MRDNMPYSSNIRLGLTGFGLSFKKFAIYIISLFLLWYIIGKLGDAYSSRAVGYVIGNRRRLTAVLRLELLMVYFSIPIYLHLFSYFNTASENDDKNVYRRQRETVRRRWFAVFMFIMVGAHITYFFYFLPFNVPYIIYWPCALSLGIWMHLFFFSMLFMTGNTIISILSLSAIGRHFISLLCRIQAFKSLITERRIQVLFTLGTTAFLSLIQWYGSDKVVIKHLELTLPHFPNTAKPLHIAMISDLHGGAMVYREQIAKVVDMTNSIESKYGVELDAIFIVGDLIDAKRQLIEDRMEPIKHFQSRLGTFVVSGNHEFYYGNYTEWAQLYKEYGINVLENQIHRIDDSVCLVGLQDLSAYKSGIKNIAMNVSVINECPHNESIVVLAHNPAATKKILNFAEAAHRDIDLILSGHTHGGQYYILIPYVYWLLPYLYGVYSLNYGQTKLLVSAGTLYQAAPMKMIGRSEIWLISIAGYGTKI